MPRKRATRPPEKPGPPALAVPRAEAEARLEKQVDAGIELMESAKAITSEVTFNEWRDTETRWRRFTTDVLNTIYTTDAPAQEFNRMGATMIALGGSPLHARIEDDLRDLQRNVNALVSLKERLELLPEPSATPGEVGDATARTPSKGDPRIFVVHGHHEATREKVVRQLEKAGPYEVIVLHERASRGKTIIEKLEQHASRSDYAVVLLTGDDLGSPSTDPKRLQPRARQNVVFELGYFIGALGRSHVTVLYEDGVELPSDYNGVVYISLADETWRFKLLQELRDAGFEYDLNKLIPA